MRVMGRGGSRMESGEQKGFVLKVSRGQCPGEHNIHWGIFKKAFNVMVTSSRSLKALLFGILHKMNIEF